MCIYMYIYIYIYTHIHTYTATVVYLYLFRLHPRGVHTRAFKQPDSLDVLLKNWIEFSHCTPTACKDVIRHSVKVSQQWILSTWWSGVSARNRWGDSCAVEGPLGPRSNTHSVRSGPSPLHYVALAGVSCAYARCSVLIWWWAGWWVLMGCGPLW